MIYLICLFQVDDVIRASPTGKTRSGSPVPSAMPSNRSIPTAEHRHPGVKDPKHAELRRNEFRRSPTPEAQKSGIPEPRKVNGESTKLCDPRSNGEPKEIIDPRKSSIPEPQKSVRHKPPISDSRRALYAAELRKSVVLESHRKNSSHERRRDTPIPPAEPRRDTPIPKAHPLERKDSPVPDSWRESQSSLKARKTPEPSRDNGMSEYHSVPDEKDSVVSGSSGEFPIAPAHFRGPWCEHCARRLLELRRQALKLWMPHASHRATTSNKQVSLLLLIFSEICKFHFFSPHLTLFHWCQIQLKY